MKTSTIIILTLTGVFLIILLFMSFAGISPFGSFSFTSPVRDISEVTNESQESSLANIVQDVEDVNEPSLLPQPSRLLSTDAIRLEIIDGKRCTMVELSKIEPAHDATAQEYRWIVDFGAFEEQDCVRMQTVNKEFIKQNITLPETGQGWTRTGKISGTTFWEHILHYGPGEVPVNADEESQ